MHALYSGVPKCFRLPKLLSMVCDLNKYAKITAIFLHFQPKATRCFCAFFFLRPKIKTNTLGLLYSLRSSKLDHCPSRSNAHHAAKYQVELFWSQKKHTTDLRAGRVSVKNYISFGIEVTTRTLLVQASIFIGCRPYRCPTSRRAALRYPPHRSIWRGQHHG